MSWIELSLDTTHEAIDWVSTLLATVDYTDDVTVENSTEQESQWKFSLRFYVPYNQQSQARVDEISHLLSPLQRTGMTTVLQIHVVEDKLTDPARQGFEYPIGQRFIILSANMPEPTGAEDKVIIRLGQTLSFGSGLHPVTRLTLQLLERHIVPGMTVLDLGSGSGILSVAMAKLGAQVLALDNDPIAVQATQENVRRNGVEQQVTVMEGSLGSGSELGHWMGGSVGSTVPTIEPAAAFDAIVANILARIHLSLTEDYHRALRQTELYQGLLITAGFTTDYEQEIDTALIEVGFTAVDHERLDDWAALVHRLT